MNVSVPRQWLGRGAISEAGYQSVGPIIKDQGGCQPPVGYPPYVPKNQAEYAHHLVSMPKNEAHGQVRQIQPGTPGVGQYTAEREQQKGNLSGTIPRTLYRGDKHRGAPYDSRHDAELQQKFF